MPGHFGGSHSHGDKNKSKGPKNSPFSSGFQGAKKTTTTTPYSAGDDNRQNYKISKTYNTSVSKETLAKNKKALEEAKMKKDMEDFANYTYEPPKFVPSVVGTVFSKVLGEKTFNVNKEYYTKNVIGKTNPKTGQAYGGTVEDFETYMRGRGSGELDAMGRTINNRDNDGGGRVVIEKNVGGSTILTETKTEAEKTADAKADAEYDARKTKRKGRRMTILTSQSGASGNFVLGKRTLLGV